MTVYLADKSAWELRRGHPAVDDGFLDLAAHGQLASCEIVALELLYSARNAANYRAIAAELATMRWLDVTHAVMARALEVQGLLAQRGAHRLPIPDLIVAATAEHYGATVLHHDHDFAVIAGVTGQSVQDTLVLWGPAAQPHD